MIIIKNAKIFTMTNKNYENGSVFIKDGKIEEVGENIDVSEKTYVIDAKGGWVLPGLIDAHCHIGLMEEGMGFEGKDADIAIYNGNPMEIFTDLLYTIIDGEIVYKKDN
jgi:imidazolonepropionase-like amidohydrolase